MADAAVSVEGPAYLKMMLHAAKYPWAAVNGFLLGDGGGSAGGQARTDVPQLMSVVRAPFVLLCMLWMELSHGRGLVPQAVFSARLWYTPKRCPLAWPSSALRRAKGIKISENTHLFAQHLTSSLPCWQICVKDAVPLFHTSTLAPLLETSASMVDAHATSNGLSIVGFYQVKAGIHRQYVFWDPICVCYRSLAVQQALLHFCETAVCGVASVPRMSWRR